ncbi:MAG: hypothetical protein J7K73_01115 [Nanoarchaeota archaeon]|nr:hypothetical protein [Nanoarchaeota archaeon]
MMSSFKLTKDGMIYKSDGVKCIFCGKLITEGETAWYIESKRDFACDICFKEKREKGLLWGAGAMVPVKIVKELPAELREEDPESEWRFYP